MTMADQVLSMINAGHALLETAGCKTDVSLGVSTASAIVTEYSAREVAGSNGLIVQGDLKVTVLAADASKPAKGSVATIAGEKFRVVEVSTEYQNGAAYLYVVQARR
jgi:hypothetical protein